MRLTDHSSLMFLEVETVSASSPTNLVDKSRSLATLLANLPVSLWIF